MKNEFSIIFNSQNEIVIFKKRGAACELNDDHKGNSILEIMKRLFIAYDPAMPHRLDRVTQGIMVIALNKESVKFYNEEIKNGTWDKYYVARVESNDKNLNSLVGVHKRFLTFENSKAEVVNKGGKLSLLEVLGIYPCPKSVNHHHVLVKLMTGRTHQIRVMLADLGLPLYDDYLYNSRADRSNKNKDLYLECIILKITDTSGTKRSFYLPNNPERDEFSKALQDKIDELK